MAVLVDTNVILSAVTDRNRFQRVRAERLFRSAASGADSIVIPQFVLFEAHYVMRNLYERDRAEVATILRELVAIPGVAVQHEIPLGLLFELWPASIGEIADASLAAVARELGCAVATFDAKLVRKLRTLRIEVWRGE